MWMMPLHLHVNQKSDYDYDILSSPKRARNKRNKKTGKDTGGKPRNYHEIVLT